MNHNHEEKLTAYALGELDGIDVENIEALIENDEEAQRYVEEIRAIGSIAEEAFATEPLGDERHEAIFETVGTAVESRNRFGISGASLGWKKWSALAACVAAVLAGVVALNAPVAQVKPSVDSLESRLGDFSVTDFIVPEESDETQIVTETQDVEVYQSLGSAGAANWDDQPTSFEIIDSNLGTVDQLMREGQAGLSDKDYERAMSLYEEVLVVDPANKEATQKLIEATSGAYNLDIEQTTRDLGTQVKFIRTGIERDKLLPVGADAKGILPPRPNIPVELGDDPVVGVRFQQASASDARVTNGSVGATDSNRETRMVLGQEIPFITGRKPSLQKGQLPNQITPGRASLPELQQASAGLDLRGGINRGRGGRGGQSGGGGFGGGGGGGGGGGLGGGAVALNTQELEQLKALGYVEIGTGQSASAPASLQLGKGIQTARVDYFRVVPQQQSQQPDHNTEAYDRITDNPFKRVVDEPLSTFSIDVDTGSYANVRRFLRDNQLPPKDAVRIEELLNYFAYTYTPPANGDPFAAHVELVECPWNVEHQLMRIGLKGREVEVHTRPAANLVFLLDVSGSMNRDNKLPLVRNAMKLLTKQLRPDDRVAIVTYAGESGLALPSTPGTEQATILSAIGRLNSGGSTNGAAGIELAYQVAQENFFDGGVNRVILATDGDFNVGTTDRGSLDRLITEKAKSGVFLTVLGVGDGNLKDATMEQLANKGNGQYAYLDSDREARKVLVEQVGGTLVTIAKDVKIQIDFNPARVGAYRLIGYENRVLAAQDFDDDTKDAGEIGAGHNVTALYEIVPPGTPIDAPSGTQSRYQVAAAPVVDTESNELLTVKLRYKQPDGDTSELLDIPITPVTHRKVVVSRDTRFAAAVAAFGMALRESPYRGTTDWDLIAGLAEDGLGKDPHGYRAEFMEMIQVARKLKPRISLRQQTVATDSPVLELLRIMPWTGGTYVAEIRTLTEKAKRYGIGDSFESFRIISIDPNAQEVVVYSEEHRGEVTLRVTKESEAHSRAENHYRLGIRQYEEGTYREALNSFTRAFALDPTMEKARDMIKKSENKITFKDFVR